MVFFDPFLQSYTAVTQRVSAAPPLLRQTVGRARDVADVQLRGKQVKIDAVEVRMLKSPIKMKRSQGVGAIADAIKRVLLVIRTDTGVVGIGEGQAWEVFSGTNENLFASLADYLRPLVLGKDPRHIQTLMQACDRALVANPEAKACLEMALYDISAKALACPLHCLLGSAVSDAIPYSFSIANPDIDADIALATQMVAEGHKIFKVKTGFASHAEDLRRLTLLREALPDDTDIRIDYNQGLAPYDAIRKLRDVEAFKPTFIEQPVPRDAIASMAAITAAIDTPIMADESVFSPAEALAIVQQKAADIISIKLMKAGGFRPASAINAIAQAAYLPCYAGTLWEGGVALAAATHFVAATPNVSLGCEFYMPRFVFYNDILVTPVTAEKGMVTVPTGPGIGVELDWDVINAQCIASSLQ
jgi:muconate cycloisomerase